MSNKILNCAVIGLGIGEQHVKALLSHPRARLSAVCDIDKKKISDFLQKYSLDNSIVKNFSEILKDTNIDTVSIASFDNDHYNQVLDCFRYGKHVFVEKPLCQTRNQLVEIHEIWKTANLALASNLILRKSSLCLWLKKVISSGEFGTIYAIDVDYLYGRIHKITDGWRSGIDNYSVMAGGGIHMVDLVMNLLGEKPAFVQSATNKIATDGTAFRYPDFHASTFYFNNKVIARVTANFGCTHRHQHVVRIFGTKATFIYDDMGARLHRSRDEAEVPEFIEPSLKVKDKGLLLFDFIDSILEGNFREKSKIEFDLMCSIGAADEAVNYNHSIVNIEYLTS